MDDARTIATGDLSPQETQDQRSLALRPGPISDNLLSRMDPQILQTLTNAQLQEIERVLAARPPRRLPIDVRITVSFFKRRYFFTFLAGREQRSPERLRRDRLTHALWTFTNVCMFVFLLLFFLPAVVGLIHMLVN